MPEKNRHIALVRFRRRVLLLDSQVSGVEGACLSAERPASESSQFRLNVLCLIGATIGLGALALPWAGISAGPLHEERAFAAWFYDFARSDRGFDEFHLAFALYLGGTIVAFLTPVGGILQLIGLTYFWAGEGERQSVLKWYSHSEGYFAVGFFFACISSAIILASIARPMGPGCRTPGHSLSCRFKVVCGHNQGQNRGSILRVLEGHRSSALAWAVSALLMATFVIASEPQMRAKEPLSQVEGGVAWLVDLRVLDSTPYSALAIVFSDGQNSTDWMTSSESLGNWTWASESFGEREVSDLSLNLTIVDFSGDMKLGPGDIVYLVAQNHTSFAEDVTYSLTLALRTGDQIFSGPPSAVVSFEFSDGDLDSRLSVENNSNLF